MYEELYEDALEVIQNGILWINLFLWGSCAAGVVLALLGALNFWHDHREEKRVFGILGLPIPKNYKVMEREVVPEATFQEWKRKGYWLRRVGVVKVPIEKEHRWELYPWNIERRKKNV